jgi:hypothetical protein
MRFLSFGCTTWYTLGQSALALRVSKCCVSFIQEIRVSKYVVAHTLCCVGGVGLFRSESVRLCNDILIMW